MKVKRFNRAPYAALIGLSISLPAPLALAQQQPPPAVVVAQAIMEEQQDHVSFAGRMVAAQKVEIRARATGFIEEILFVEGKPISAGDVLYRIEKDTYEAALSQIEGQIASATAERDLAVLERARQEELVARNAAPARNFDQAVAAVGQAEGALMTLMAQKRQAELELGYTTIAAPFDGMTGLSQYDVGALVGPDAGALVTLTRIDPIYAEFPVSTRIVQNYLAAQAAGEEPEIGTVTLRLANGAEPDLTGTITYADSSVAEGTDTILVRAEFPNPDGMLRDGEFVQVILNSAAGEPVLTIPAQAISRDLSGNFVMVVDADGIVTRRQIDTGPTSQGHTVVTGGLEAGEHVITEGLNKVRPGIQVNAAPASTPNRG